MVYRKSLYGVRAIEDSSQYSMRGRAFRLHASLGLFFAPSVSGAGQDEVRRPESTAKKQLEEFAVQLMKGKGCFGTVSLIFDQDGNIHDVEISPRFRLTDETCRQQSERIARFIQLDEIVEDLVRRVQQSVDNRGLRVRVYFSANRGPHVSFERL